MKLLIDTNIIMDVLGDIPCLTPDEVYAKFGADILGSDKP